jgi:hypothetical protein
MLWEFYVVLRNDNVQSTRCIFDFNQFQYFHVILAYLWCHKIGCNIDNINVWIFQTEDSRKLTIFALLILLKTHSSQVRNTETVNMDFDATLITDGRPGLLEFFLHFRPDAERFLLQTLDFELCRFFQLVKTIFPLYKGSFYHQMFELAECTKSLMSAPSRLYLYCRQYRSIGAFEHLPRILHCL